MLLRKKTEIGSSIFIQAQFIVTPENRSKVELFEPHWLAEPGVDQAAIRHERAHAGRTVRHDQYQNREELRQPCRYLWESVVIMQDGTAMPCCKDFDAKAPPGNAFEQDMGEIWDGDTAYEGVGIMVSTLSAEIVARVRQEVNTNEYSRCEIFASPFANVSVQTHPALTPLLRSHLYYPDTPSAADIWSVSAVESDYLWDFAVEQLNPAWTPVLDYGTDGHVVDIDQQARLIMIPSTRTVIVRDCAEKKVYIVGRDVRGLFVELYRVVRGVHTASAINSGAMAFHSSSVVRQGRGVCFVGDKGAGKSTALLAAATSHLDGLSILTNDRAFLHFDRDLEILAWPSAVNVDAGSLLALGGDRVLKPEFHYRYGAMAYLLLDLPLIEKLSTGDEASAPAKVMLLPEEMRRALGTSFSTEGRVVAIIESKLALDEPHSRFELVFDADERANLVRRNACTDWTNHPDWLGLITTSPGEESVIGRLEEVADDVAIARLRVGRDGKDVTRGLIAAFTSSNSPIELGTEIAAGPLPTYHFGVYARIVRDGRLLCVKKTRGPYTGLLDLPGGRPEFAENWEDALRRELAEEVGAESVSIANCARFSLHVDFNTAGENIDFHHHGAVADVHLWGALSEHGMSSSDTNGWEWFDLGSGDRLCLSPLARSVLDG